MKIINFYFYRRKLFFFVVILFSQFWFYLLPAQNEYSIENSSLFDPVEKLWSTQRNTLEPEEWHASWIWQKGENEGGNLILLARKHFYLRGQPEQARLYITADNNYELFINGEFVNRGPALCAAHHQSYDILEIAPTLKEGKNIIAIRVLHHGRFRPYNTIPRPGIFAQLEISVNGSQEIFITDSSWRVKKPEGINLNYMVFGESTDFRKEEKGWQELEFDDTRWDNAEELLSDKGWPAPSLGEIPKAITFPWLSLVARDIPYLKESLIKATVLHEVGEILELSFNNPVASGANGLLYPKDKSTVNGLKAYQQGENSIIIKNNYPSNIFSSEGIYSTYLIFDMNELMHGYPKIELEGEPGTIVEILYAPHLLRGKFPLRAHIRDRPLTDRFVLTKGKTVWEALELRDMRYMFIAFRNTDKPVSLSFAGINRVQYPFKPCGSFLIQKDDELEWLWQASVNTLFSITTDAFTDNYRERFQYAQTSYYAARASYAAFGDTYLQRQYLKQIAQEQRNDGILPANAPIESHVAYFLDASLFWIMGLHDYYLHSGDKETTEELMPSARKILERFFQWENNEGFIESPPYNYWIDHADVERAGANFSLNALYILAMQDFMKVLQWVGNNEEANEYEERIAKLRMNLRDKFWDEDKKLFSDALIGENLSVKFTEHSNSLAIVAGIASSGQQQEIVKEILENKSARLVPAVLFMHYVAEALFMSGYSNQALALLKDRYRHMKTEGSQTLWEEWSVTVSKRTGKFLPNDRRTIAQAENTFLLYSLTRWLLGVQPNSPGMNEVLLSCNLCGLNEIKACMPSPSGIIQIKWKSEKKIITLDITVPDEIHVKVDLESKDIIGKRIVSMNGKNIEIKLLKERFLEIPSGKHQLKFY